jgi:hypothetical protein
MNDVTDRQVEAAANILLKTSPVLGYDNIREAIKAVWRVRRKEESEAWESLQELLRKHGRLDDDSEAV